MEAPTESIFRIDSSFPSDRLGSVVLRAICDVQSLHFCVFILERVKFYKNKKKRGYTNADHAWKIQRGNFQAEKMPKRLSCLLEAVTSASKLSNLPRSASLPSPAFQVFHASTGANLPAPFFGVATSG